jgi:hypothetical protein
LAQDLLRYGVEGVETAKYIVGAQVDKVYNI